MLAAIKTEKQKEIILRDEVVPELKEGELLIKVKCCGVCGSDLHAFINSKGYEFVQKPIILGHEITGEVADCFDQEDKELIGQRVIIESMHYCNKCDNCRAGRYSICEKNKVIGLHFNGGMAEYVKTDKRFVSVIPDDLQPEIAALSEPMAIAVHAVKKAGEIRKGQQVLVQGPGIIGLFTGLVCLEKGANVILSGLEKDYEYRLSKAREFEITPHISGDENLQEKVEILFECSGSNYAFSSGFNHLKKGGKAVVVALYEQAVSLFLTDLVRNEWPIITSYGCDPADYEEAFNMLQKHQTKLQQMISLYSLNETETAFLDSLSQKILKAVLLVENDTGGYDN